MPAGKSRPGVPVMVFSAAMFSFLAFFLLYPVGLMLRQAFVVGGHFSLGLFADLWMNPVRRECILNSILIGTIVTAACVVVSTPLALLVARYSFKGKKWLTGLVLVPMIMPPFVGAIGMKQILSPNGTVDILVVKLLSSVGAVSPDAMGVVDLARGGLLGVIILETLHLYPIMYLNVTAALANVDPAMEEAARNLGASPWRLLRTVTAPLAMPGFFAGAILVFIWAFTDLGTPLIFDFAKVIPVAIYNDSRAVNENPSSFSLIVFVIAVCAGAFFLSKHFSDRRTYFMLSKDTRAKPAIQLSAKGTTFAYALFGGVTLLAVLPHLSVILMSFSREWVFTAFPTQLTLEYYRDIFSRGETVGAIKNSMLYIVGSTAFDVVLGVGVAYVLARKKFPGAALLDAIAMMPLALPGFVVAFGYIVAFMGTGYLIPAPNPSDYAAVLARLSQSTWYLRPWDWGLLAWHDIQYGVHQFLVLDPFLNPTLVLMVSYSVRRLPFMVRSVYAGFQQVSPSLEEAAANLGASPSRTLRTITFPLVLANILAGGILCFSFAMLEVSDSMILASARPFYPITKTIYDLSMNLKGGDNLAAAMGVFGMILLVVSLLAAGRVLGERMGELFRT